MEVVKREIKKKVLNYTSQKTPRAHFRGKTKAHFRLKMPLSMCDGKKGREKLVGTHVREAGSSGGGGRVGSVEDVLIKRRGEDPCKTEHLLLLLAGKRKSFRAVSAALLTAHRVCEQPYITKSRKQNTATLAGN